jgi:thiosulfate dehydrogenase [quinone] large subunit
MGAFDSRVMGYTTLRFAMGTSMLIHGLNRIGHVPGFADKTAELFAATWLPRPAVLGFAYATAPVELAIGLLVLPGLFTRAGLVLGGLWMVPLIFGSTLIERYDWVGIQLVYALIFFVLLYHHGANVVSADTLLWPRGRGPDAGPGAAPDRGGPR